MLTDIIFTVRNEVTKVIFSQPCVCPQGEGSASVHAGIQPPPPGPDSPGPDTPWDQTPPWADNPPPEETATAADSTHPTGMHSCCLMWRYYFINFVVILLDSHKNFVIFCLIVNIQIIWYQYNFYRLHSSSCNGLNCTKPCKTTYYYRPQTKLRKGNVFTSVCQEVCPQWGVY